MNGVDNIVKHKHALTTVVCFVLLVSCSGHPPQDMKTEKVPTGNDLIPLTSHLCQNTEKGQVNLYFKEQSTALVSAEGRLYGYLGAKVPVLFQRVGEESEVPEASLDLINSYFEETSNSFLESEGIQRAKEQVNYTLFHLGNEPHPIFSAIQQSEVSQNDNNILSVRQIEHWFLGGTNADYEDGVTFDLKTGQVLTLSDFIPIPLNEFHNKLEIFLRNTTDSSAGGQLSDNFREVYAYSNYDEYPFFIYEDTPYIILRAQSTSEVDKIVRWSTTSQAPEQLYRGRRFVVEQDETGMVTLRQRDGSSVLTKPKKGDDIPSNSEMSK